MTHYTGISVSLETSSICIVDAQGAICRDFKVESESEAMAAAVMGAGFTFSRIGLEAGPLSQWLHAGLTKVRLLVVLLETRQLRATTKAVPVKTDRTSPGDGAGGANRWYKAARDSIPVTSRSCSPISRSRWSCCLPGSLRRSCLTPPRL
jgi:transposase